MITEIKQLIQNKLYERIVYKTTKELCKESEKRFIPYTANTRIMCEKIGKPEYFEQIRNRIYNAVDNDEDLGHFIHLDYECPEDIFLNNEGLCAFADILEGYFSKEHLADLRRYMRYKNEASQIRYNLAETFKRSTVPQLKELVTTYIKMKEQPDQKETCDILISMINAELKKRRNPFKQLIKT